ncbi:MAG TPA: solute:sodium symporter family transporter, partial [bacterium]|nr:solute:sodium symporter family transporter [bacterium]
MEDMIFTLGDGLIFLAFFAIVIIFSMWKSRKEESGEDYFLAGRNLIWPLIGLSMIAANISSEQFVGMSGQGAGSAGLAIASYEWMAAITMVIVAMFFLPTSLKAGIYTFPEFL